MKGGPFGDIKNVLKGKQNMRTLNSFIVPKNVKRGPFRLFQHPFCCKNQKVKGDGPFGDIKLFSKKCLTKPGKVKVS